MRSRFASILAVLLAVVAVTSVAAVVTADEAPLWLRYPAISPDGKTVLFEYKGDLYSVPSTGGTAVPLTLSDSYEFAPVWSHDGKTIAFASDRYGNFDVFVMPASGGEAKRPPSTRPTRSRARSRPMTRRSTSWRTGSSSPRTRSSRSGC